MAELPAAIKWENFIFTHAGVIPGLMFNQPLKGFIRNRYIEPRDGKWIFSASWQGEDGDWKHMPQAVHWSEAYNGNETIVYGHEPRKDIHTVNKTIGIDTGCCFNGKLSAMIIDKETKEYTFEQVQAKQVYHKE
jgi:diadenosine tetraphosphatase ApaH/serine/threonine PP2A family protein phosphatase